MHDCPCDADAVLEPDDETGDLSVTLLQHYADPAHPLLTAQEKAVLDLRFRLSGQRRAASLGETGDLLRLTPDAVRGLQDAALAKLRRAAA